MQTESQTDRCTRRATDTDTLALVLLLDLGLVLDLVLVLALACRAGARARTKVSRKFHLGQTYEKPMKLAKGSRGETHGKSVGNFKKA